MIRNLKSFALAFVAVLAMSAVVSSVAQAVPSYTCSAYPCTATGANPPGNETLTTPGGSLACSTHYLVEKYKGTNEGITAPASQVTVTGGYGECTAFGFLSAMIAFNGCDFVFTATEKLAIGRYAHHVDIVCPDGKSITKTAGTCEVDIPAQAGLTSATTQNLSNGSITLELNMKEITLNVTKDGFGCPFAGTGHVKGTYHGDVVLSRIGGGSLAVSGE